MGGLRHVEIPFPSGLGAVWWKVERYFQIRWLVASRLKRDAQRIWTLSQTYAEFSAEDLQRRLQEHKNWVNLGRSFQIAGEEEALALICEAAIRTTGMRPYPVQIMGALAVERGFLTEMQTGEGKSLTAGLAAVMAAWTGKPCHVLTSNSYLAARDAEAFHSFYAACGLTVASVGDADQDSARRATYTADIVYTTAKELLADLLRDVIRMGSQPTPTALCLQKLSSSAETSGRVLRGLGVAIADEADSLLIDDAVTPLIIAAEKPLNGFDEAIEQAVRIAGMLQQGRHFDVQAALRRVQLNDSGIEFIARFRDRFRPPWSAPARVTHLVNLAVTARILLKHGRHFLIEDGKIILLDEQTGRRAPGRHFTDGLHQALEIFEGLEPTPLSEIAGRRSFQRFFRQFPRLSGLTGTGLEAAAEFWSIYRLQVIKIPTHAQSRRRDDPPRLLPDQATKFAAIANEALSVASGGRAVLIGTRSIGSAEIIADLVRNLGGAPRLLTAADESVEATIVGRAGEISSITIATNMAGRGTDIRVSPSVEAAGGLHVILAEVNDLKRIDRQMAGRAARQGEAGSSRKFLAPDDLVFQRALSAPVRTLVRRAALLPAPISGVAGSVALWFAQAKLAKLGIAIRRAVLASDLQFEESGL